MGLNTESPNKRNVTNSMKLLTDNIQNGILLLNDKTLNQLKQKYPQSKEPELDVLLTDIPKQLHPIKFDAIDVDLVKSAAVRTSRKSGLDEWSRTLMTTASVIYVEPLLKSSRNYAQQIIFHLIRSILACSLIPLDKNPALRQIGIGEILRRVAGKVNVTHVTLQISILILRKKTQNKNIFTQFEFILVRPNSKSSGITENLIETFSSHFK